MLNWIVRWSTRIGITMQVVKTVIAAALALLVASMLFGEHFSYFAPLAAVLTVQITIADTMERGIYRVLGVIIGVVVTMLITPLIGYNFIGLAVVLLIGMGAATALKLNPLIISQVGVSSVMVMSMQQAAGYATGRIIETIVGALIAVAVQIVIRPENRVPFAKRRSTNICLKLAEQLTQLSRSIAGDDASIPHCVHDAELMKWIQQLTDSYSSAEKSLKYNVVYRKDSSKLTELALQVESVKKIIIAVSSINYAVRDISPEHLRQLPIQASLASTADCLLTYGKIIRHATPIRMDRIEGQIARANEDQLHLFKVYQEYNAHVETLMEVGSLFADLHRIVAEVEHVLIHVAVDYEMIREVPFQAQPQTQEQGQPQRIVN